MSTCQADTRVDSWERERDTSNTITTGKESESIRKTNKRKKQIAEIEEHHEDRNKMKKRKIAGRKEKLHKEKPCRHLISLKAVSDQLQLPALLPVCVYVYLKKWAFYLDLCAHVCMYCVCVCILPQCHISLLPH